MVCHVPPLLGCVLLHGVHVWYLHIFLWAHTDSPTTTRPRERRNMTTFETLLPVTQSVYVAAQNPFTGVWVNL